MSSNYGVNAVVSTDAARSVYIESTTPIGVVVTSDILDEGLHFFDSPKKAKEAAASATDGTIIQVLDGIHDQNASMPLILSVVRHNADEAALKTAVINGCSGLSNAQAQFGYTPNLIAIPWHSHDLDVATEMQSIATALRGTAIIDLNASDETEAVTAAGNFSSQRVLLCDPYVKAFNTTTESTEFQPASHRVAGMIAAVDGSREYGFSDSFSNRVMLGISGTSRPVDFTAGAACEADRLRGAKVSTIINYKGFRSWGAETTDIDPIWQDLVRVRVFDRLVTAALDGLFWAIDRLAVDVLKEAKDSVEQMLLGLRGAGKLVDFEVEWDAEQNTQTNITDGKFYMTARVMNTPIVKRLEINFNYTDQYAPVLVKLIS